MVLGVPLILEYCDSTIMSTLSLSAARAGWCIPLATIVAFPDCNKEVPCIKRKLDAEALDALLKRIWTGFWCHLTLDVA